MVRFPHSTACEQLAIDWKLRSTQYVHLFHPDVPSNSMRSLDPGLISETSECEGNQGPTMIRNVPHAQRTVHCQRARTRMRNSLRV